MLISDLKTPGPANFNFSISEMFSKIRSLILLAKIFGFILFDFDKTNATLVDNSKLNFSGGTSKFTLLKFVRSLNFKISLLSFIILLIFDK